jgi:uncharacterized repeat protein (TIGR03803 family)/parallel beta-helix repeat protein
MRRPQPGRESHLQWRPGQRRRASWRTDRGQRPQQQGEHPAGDQRREQSGATIQVAGNQQYQGNLTINKSLTLQGSPADSSPGADSSAPELVGTVAGGTVIAIAASHVTVAGFRLSGLVAGGALSDSHNAITGSGSNITVTDNTVTGFDASGIAMTSSNNLTVQFNTFTDIGADAIDVTGGTGVVIERNVIQGSGTGTFGAAGYGIHVTGSNAAQILSNEVSGISGGSGAEKTAIFVQNSPTALVSANTISGIGGGFGSRFGDGISVMLQRRRRGRQQLRPGHQWGHWRRQKWHPRCPQPERSRRLQPHSRSQRRHRCRQRRPLAGVERQLGRHEQCGDRGRRRLRRRRPSALERQNSPGLTFTNNSPSDLPTPPAAGFEVLHDFTLPDGVNPLAGVMQASDGYFYGTTQSGGQFGYGTIYRVDSSGNFLVMHSFAFGSDGANPTAALIEGHDGYLYGTAQAGPGGCGVVFKMDTVGSFSVVHAFTGTDGCNPRAPLLLDADGRYYGTTYSGGTTPGGGTGSGTVFKLDAAGNHTVLKVFDGVPAFPGYDPLVRGSDGHLYGTTGTPSDAPEFHAVYRMSSNGIVTVLHSFDGTGLLRPSGLLKASDSLYGTTGIGTNSAGYGTVFEMDQAGSVTVLHELDPATEGSGPRAGLIRGTDGYFYGTTSSSVFRMDAAGNVTVLHLLKGNDGANLGRLFLGADGRLYGTATYTTPGNPVDNFGLIFRVTLGDQPALTSQTITVTQGAPATAVFGTGFSAAATASSGLTVTIGASGACSISGGT